MTEPAEGILIVNKEAGMTSADVVARVRRISGIRRVGHTGTLDPFATGVLPVCTGRATAAAGFMLNWAKRYRCGIRLGYTTSTLDSQGQVTEEAADPSRWRSFLDEKDRGASARLKEAVNSLTAIRSQQAPLYSAVKVKGKPLYRYAREGLEVERPVRQVTVHEAALLGVEPDEAGYPLVTVEFLVSAGTYIRSLAGRLGELVACPAHAAWLVRLAAGHFDLSMACQLDSLADGWTDFLRPVGEAFRGWPGLELTRKEALDLAHGRQIACSEEAVAAPSGEAGRLSPPPDVHWLACRLEGRLIAAATREEDGLLRARRVFVRPQEL
ncbi:MAG TPA: tRNA pseudouridine(55) synthase TruB [Bacillota bacterium]|jgi:tRNA pseudouridine55 synthase|nr:tRNA pseudouridine(55) synthase TruB [Fastidiosipila sp.]HPX92926.1 tRNA pseudouridine(55) synthase TruB [Bacillota bacterium]HQB80684.1 tRNA pseudouridine(55) synthase TruB [Bacillota bacterium]